MRNLLGLSADRLRVQAIIACTASLLAASALPVVSYIYVFQYAATELGPFAWTHWAVVGFACLLGLSAHSLNHRALLALHAALCCMLGAALGGFDTAFWYQLTTRCQTFQSVFTGCQGCTCANSNTCTAANLANDVQCQGCKAYPVEACQPAVQTTQQFVIAFTGLAAVVFLALPVFYSLLVLCRLEGSAAVDAARRQMVSFAVDQQTTLVESNEKPNVTPSMLGAWVGFLLASGDDGCAAIGEKCRTVLAGRGFELDIKLASGSKRTKAKAKRPAKRGASKEIVADSSRSSAAADSEAYAAAEAGSRPIRPGQVAADRHAQFVTHAM